MLWKTALSSASSSPASDSSPAISPCADSPPRRWFGRPSGPGLREALLWFWGVALAHNIAAAMMALFLFYLIRAIYDRPLTIVEMVQSNLLDPWFVPWLGGEQLLCFLFIVIAARRRITTCRYWTALTRVRPAHWVQTLLLILPLATLCSQVYLWAGDSWEQLAQKIPGVEGLDQMQAMNIPGLLRDRASLPVVLLILAVIPAIGEELVFRGVIGRGLTHRLGLFAGVLVTSVLFGMIHMHPAHALAVIPLGIALHLIAIWSGSLGPPILLHFLNNSLAVISLMSDSRPPSQAMHESPASPALLISAAALAATLFWGMYRTRAVTSTAPSGQAAVTPAPSRSTLYLTCLTLSLLAFTSLFLANLFNTTI
ncbi:MAG: CPBP family intramembrane glutamic endopeptidase [Planctomycetales bacterium]